MQINQYQHMHYENWWILIRTCLSWQWCHGDKIQEGQHIKCCFEGKYASTYKISKLFDRTFRTVFIFQIGLTVPELGYNGYPLGYPNNANLISFFYIPVFFSIPFNKLPWYVARCYSPGKWFGQSPRLIFSPFFLVKTQR